MPEEEDRERCPELSDKRRTIPHCFCQPALIQHAMMNHRCVKCCWCGYEKCEIGKVVQEEGHGPFATITEWI